MVDIDEITNYLKAISDPTRLKMVEMLNRHSTPLCVNAIARKLNVTQSAISQHLRILKQVGIVTSSRSGYNINYRLKYDKINYFSSQLEQVLTPTNENTEHCDGDCH